MNPRVGKYNQDDKRINCYNKIKTVFALSILSSHESRRHCKPAKFCFSAGRNTKTRRVA